MSDLHKKIMLTLDGSEFAARAVPHAVELAECSGAQLIIVQVVENMLDYIVMPAETISAMAFVQSGEAHTQAVNTAKLYVDDLVDRLRHRKVNATADVIVGDPATSIVEYATEHEVDLIVMSTHGRTGLARWAYGSVTNKVLQAAPCSVLVVRTDVANA